MADKKIKIIAAAIIVITIIGIAGIALRDKSIIQEDVSTNKNASPTKEEIVPIKYVYSSLILSDPPRLAKELGYYKKIDIQKTEVGGVNSLVALAAGEVDVVHASYTSGVIAIAKGAKIKSVGSFHSANTFVFDFFVLDDSPIRSAKDLKGKKIGGSRSGTSYLVLIEYLKSANLSIGDIDLVTLPTGTHEQALRGKQVDVVTIGSEWEKTVMLDRGGVRVLFKQIDMLPKGTHHCGIWVTEKFIKEKPEILKEFLDGFVKAADWERENPAKAKELNGKLFERESKKNPAPLLKNSEPSDMREHAFVTDVDVQWFIDRYVELGELKKGEIKPSDIYTNEFNPYYRG